ncbi:MAG: pseudouridine synthase [Comamonas sp.]
MPASTPPSPPPSDRKTLSLSRPAPRKAPPSSRFSSPARPGRPAAPAPAPQPRAKVWRADDPKPAFTAAVRPEPQPKPEGAVRLNKRMSDQGLCSRREGDAWIENGWVRVNGEVAVMGQLVTAHDRIEIDKAAQNSQEQQVTILLNKPMGYVSGQAEDGHEPAMKLITAQSRWNADRSKTRFNFAQLKGLAPCGRLDIDSVGLLVLTQDGRVARQIIGEDSDMDKEYLVRVTYGSVAQDVQSRFPADKLALLRHGLSLDGQALLPAQVDWQNPEQLRFVLREGKKRQIRRMCEQVGLFVVGLKRIRIGRVALGNLPVGQWRYLAPGEGF